MFNNGKLAFLIASLVSFSAESQELNNNAYFSQYENAAPSVTDNKAQGSISSDLANTLLNAYNNNERIQSERKNLQYTDEFMSQAFSQWMPSLSADGQIGHSYVDRNTTSSRGEFDSLGADLTLPIYRGGRTIALSKREKSRVIAAVAELQNVEQEVLFDAVEAYIDVWRDSKLLDYSLKNEAMLKKSLDETKVKFDLKEVTQTDVFQAQTRYTRALSDKIRRKANLENSQSRYRKVVGANPSVLYHYGSPEIYKFLDLKRFSYDDMKKIALSSHPSILVGLNDAEAAEHDIRLKKGALLPTVALNASIDKQNGEILSLGSEDVEKRSVFLSASVPIFQNGSEYSNVRQAKRKAEKAKFDLEERKNIVLQDLNVALENLYASMDENRNNFGLVEAAERSLEGVSYEVQSGTRTVLDLLDAQQELLDAQIVLTRAQHSEFLSSYSLLKSLGMLTAEGLKLTTGVYDPSAYNNSVKHKVIGF